MTKIKITDEQKAKLPSYNNKWLTIGQNTETHRELAEAEVDNVYKMVGKPPPTKKVWCLNPVEGMREAQRLTGKQDVLSDVCYGSHDIGWFSFFDFFLSEIKLDCVKPLEPMIKMASYCGWFWPYEDMCILTNKPTRCKLNSRNQLHSLDGPALAYAGEGFDPLYYVNGTAMEVWMIETPPDKLDLEKVMNIKNVEQRAETMKRVGVNKFLDKINAKVLDKLTVPYKVSYDMINGVKLYRRDGRGELSESYNLDYELLAVDFSNGVYPERICLKMYDRAASEDLVQWVHPDCKTCEQALAFRKYGKIDIPYSSPWILT